MKPREVIILCLVAFLLSYAATGRTPTFRTTDAYTVERLGWMAVEAELASQPAAGAEHALAAAP